MGARVNQTCLAAVIIITLVVFGAACSKKTVIPPESQSGSATALESGVSTLDYPPATSIYDESNLPVEGALDDSATTGPRHMGSLVVEDAMAASTEEYKQTYGRSSGPLLPIYFDFDRAAIRADMETRLIDNATFLAGVPNNLIIEGNCDDRGTMEYNLALGEKRAINVRDYLINLGINPSRIRTVSYGEERPLFFEQTEFAWSQNRRADLVLE
ncbi:MAG: OmpA family protein [Desulfofustis sp. PB-SRB1]|jgi:peptidoglycan-associated lipoprotein|nr:OmpA family protein [Desulfofustis sp. PB-SRB1]HBH28768.1 peptidoglycan-associated lipoprotein [Desulfofustis sp.]HBH32497.1 peptidoglycan-associated lipoprotein [Desulfofustis sp.]